VLICAENLGIPLPGETALIAAALYAGSTHHLEIVLVVLVAAAAGIIGNNIGYLLGDLGGWRLLLRYGKYIRMNEDRIKVGRYLFDRHGGKVVFFGRFVAVLRTYAAFLAGTNKMHWRRFMFFNASGGIIWASIYGFGAYELGSKAKHVSSIIAIVGIALAVVAIAAGVIIIRRSEAKLVQKALVEFPGPLEAA
jgi:membrane protein DedA with SNARE-associated domain